MRGTEGRAGRSGADKGRQRRASGNAVIRAIVEAERHDGRAKACEEDDALLHLCGSGLDGGDEETVFEAVRADGLGNVHHAGRCRCGGKGGLEEEDFAPFAQSREQRGFQRNVDRPGGEHGGRRGRRVDGGGAQGVCGAQDAAGQAQGLFQQVLRQAGGERLGEFGIAWGGAKAFEHFSEGQLRHALEVRD